MYTLGHEVTHYIREWSPAKFKVLQDFVMKQMGVDAETAIAEKMASLKSLGIIKDTMTVAEANDIAAEEVVADGMELILTDGKVLKELSKTDKSLWEKIRDWIADVIDKIRKHYEGLNQASKTARVLKETMDSLDEIERLFTEGAKEAGERARAAETGEVAQGEGENVYSFTPADFEKPITLRDIEILRSIGRKSINAFTSADIEKAQKWAYKFYKDQKLGTKSPFFRAWFGDWRAYDKTPLEVADIPEYVATNEARKQQRGVVQNRDTKWDIRISREGETNTISHAGADRRSEYGLAGIQSLIKNAVLLDSEVHEHHSNNAKDDRITFDHKLYALGRDTSGGIALYKITVEEQYANYKDPHDKRFHNLKYIEKVADGIGSLTHSQSRGAESTNDASTTIYSIADLFAFVKQYDKEFSPKPVNELMLDENKEPRVFYHGTRKENGEFWEFDYNKAKKKGGLGFKSFGQGNYFTSQKLTGTEMYGSRVIPAYLHIENPAVIQMGKGEQLRTKASELLGVNAEHMTYPEIQKEMRRKGIDGVVALDESGNVAIAVTFESTQIKSATDNIGTFDGNNPDIRYSIDESAENADVSENETEATEEEVSDRDLLLAMAEQMVGNEAVMDHDTSRNTKKNAPKIEAFFRLL